MFRFVIGLKINGKEVEGGSYGGLCFSEKERGKVLNIIWKGSLMKKVIWS